MTNTTDESKTRGAMVGIPRFSNPPWCYVVYAMKLGFNSQCSMLYNQYANILLKHSEFNRLKTFSLVMVIDIDQHYTI